jgi:hypothetical protein
VERFDRSRIFGVCGHSVRRGGERILSRECRISCNDRFFVTVVSFSVVLIR